MNERIGLHQLVVRFVMSDKVLILMVLGMLLLSASGHR